MKVTAIFDIGKTNKKFILFDKRFKEVYREYAQFKEVKDEDGFPADDLEGIVKWIKKTLAKISRQKVFKIAKLNFSTYGASLVHLDKKGKVLTPLYNYLKPIPKKTLKEFHRKHGAENQIAKETASPQNGMLNAGLQLYWLKKTRPKVFSQIRWSLHFPQYLSYLFTGELISDFTSIGCHTSLWDFEKRTYHDWVFSEGMDKILADIKPSDNCSKIALHGLKIKIGPGIHDSSAALLPYLQKNKKPFLLLSTGTWNVALNPFSTELLSGQDIENDCLFYMRVDGHPVKAVRLFLGNEYRLQTKKLAQYFNKKEGYHKRMSFDKKIFKLRLKKFSKSFHFASIQSALKDSPFDNKNVATDLGQFSNIKEAHHQLMMELVLLQIQTIEKAIGHSKIKKIYVDGGFAANEIFLKLLALYFRKIKVKRAKIRDGAALGAALQVSNHY